MNARSSRTFREARQERQTTRPVRALATEGKLRPLSSADGDRYPLSVLRALDAVLS